MYMEQLMIEKRPLNIWVLKDGETLPVIKDAKKMRTWRLSEALADRGHNVTWWSSNFYHTKKEKVFEGDKIVELRNNLTVKLLDCGSYKKNISLQRIRHHSILGKKFATLAKSENKPDIIISSLPTIEFPVEAVKYGKKNNVPVIIDVRDMWPDIILDYFPIFLRPFLRVPIIFCNIKIKSCLKNAQGIVSMTEDILNFALDKAKLKRDDKKDIFYLGYDESCVHDVETIKELQKLPRNKTIFSYLGSFNNSNDLDLIVEAAKILEKDEKINAHFVFAGDGDLWISIREKVKNIKNITLLGWINKKQSAYLMKLTDVCIIPSKVPAIPNKFFEALFFSNPILFCMEGESKAILETHHAGIFYKKGDVQSLIASINIFLEGEKLQELKKNAHKLYDTQFKSHKIYTSYCEYIERIYLTYEKNFS